MSRSIARGTHVVALLLGAMACGSGKAPPRHHEVRMRAGTFVPATLRVAVGDTVTWRNDDIVPHTVTGAAWRSGNMGSGQVATRVITEADLGPYACDYHPAMTGTLAVETVGP